MHIIGSYSPVKRNMKKPRDTLGTIWFFLKPYKYSFLLIFIISVLLAITETLHVAILYPILQGTLDIQSGQDNNFFLFMIGKVASILPFPDMVIANIVVFILLTVLFFLFRMVYLAFSLKITAGIVIERKQQVFQKLIRSDYQFFADNKQGELLYKAVTAPVSIAAVLMQLTQFVVDFVISVSILVLLFSLSLVGTLAAIILGAGYYYYIRYLGSKVSYVAGTGRREASQRENVVVSEFVTGVKHIKAFDSSPYWYAQFNEAMKRYWAYWRRSNFWLQTPGNIITLILFAMVGFAVIIVRIQNPIDFATIIPIFGTFIFAIFKLLPRLSSFGMYQMQIMDVLPTIEIVRDLLLDTTYDKITSGHVILKEFNSGIEFRNLTFTHKKREATLYDVSLKIEKNKTTAIVGASGAGKSTVADLLLRLYDVDSGGIYIDGVNIKEYDTASLLSKIGFVGQETFIYNASVKDNISFGHDYPMPEIIEAAKLANAHEFIQRLPDGYDTLLGDRGVKISGGEKQRIAIARAMVRKPEILILDEATSSLDNISERLVQESIDIVTKNCTALIIAHRLSTIRNADMIYVLDQGKLVESGTHEGLLQQKGKYSMSYGQQRE